jgi:hypothetical protein
VSLDLLKQVQGELEDLRKSLEAQNDAPSVAAPNPVGPTGSAPAPSRGVLDMADKMALREELKTKSNEDLHAMFSLQARRKDTGIPFDVWASAGGSPTMQAVEKDPVLSKALDTVGATALIRQDLEPILYELYIREFPYWTRIAKEPANGLVHAYDRVTSFGDAQFMPELGTVTDDTSVYERATTPVSVIATRRGVSLKSQFAVQAGGMPWSPEQLELQGGLRAIAHKMQKTIFQGNATTTGGSAATELGAYDANSFDGLRKTLDTARALTVDPTGATPESFREKINDACVTIMQNAGRAQIAYMDPLTKALIDYQQDENVRYMNDFVNVGVGILTNAINTVFGPMPLAVVPGDSIGSYFETSTEYRDIYLLDETSISVPYLGSDGPTVLDIPIGISGQLTHLYIVFGMWGMAVKVPQFSNKVRVVQA